MSVIRELQEWKDAVLEKDGSRCVNCEKTRQVAACFVVPPEAGGILRPTNGVTLCRECRIAADGARTLPQRIDNKTPINFLISKELHDIVDHFARKGSKFGSVSALVRKMISSFITSPELYEDMGLWQDDGSDLKVNGWVDGNQYEVFKRMCQDRGFTYTNALKSLLLVAVEGYRPEEERH